MLSALHPVPKYTAGHSSTIRPFARIPKVWQETLLLSPVLGDDHVRSLSTQSFGHNGLGQLGMCQAGSSRWCSLESIWNTTDFSQSQLFSTLLRPACFHFWSQTHTWHGDWHVPYMEKRIYEHDIFRHGTNMRISSWHFASEFFLSRTFQTKSGAWCSYHWSLWES